MLGGDGARAEYVVRFDWQEYAPVGDVFVEAGYRGRVVTDAEVSPSRSSRQKAARFCVHDQSGYNQICFSHSLLDLLMMLFRRVEFDERGGVKVKDQ